MILLKDVRTQELFEQAVELVESRMSGTWKTYIYTSDFVYLMVKFYDDMSYTKHSLDYYRNFVIKRMIPHFSNTWKVSYDRTYDDIVFCEQEWRMP